MNHDALNILKPPLQTQADSRILESARTGIAGMSRVVSIFKWLDCVNERYGNWNVLGTIVLSAVTGIGFLLLLLPLALVFPSQRDIMLVVAPVSVGLGVGYVYGRTESSAWFLPVVAHWFHYLVWDSSQPLTRNLICFALFVGIHYVGFGLSRWVKHHAASNESVA